MRTDGDLWCTIIILFFFFFSSFRFSFMAFPKNDVGERDDRKKEKKKKSEARHRYEYALLTAWPLTEPE